MIVWTCMTQGCECVGYWFDGPGFCSICLDDLVGIADQTGEVRRYLTRANA